MAHKSQSERKVPARGNGTNLNVKYWLEETVQKSQSERKVLGRGNVTKITIRT